MSEPSLPELEFVLPGSWWAIDLQDSTASAASIRGLVARVGGRRDEFATLRQELRRSLEGLAARAHEQGATDFYLAIELIPGVPVPLSLSVFWPEVQVAAASPSMPNTVLDLVRTALQSRDDASEYGDGEIEQLGESVAWSRQRVLHVPDEAHTPGHDTLISDWWMVVPRTQRVVLLSFSSTYLGHRELILELFRTIVVMSRWVDRARSTTVGSS